MKKAKKRKRQVLRVVLPPDDDQGRPWFLIIQEDHNHYYAWLMHEWPGTKLKPRAVIGPGTLAELIKLCRVFL